MSRWALPAIILLAFLLRVYGIGFGLPNIDHAKPYNPDEFSPLQVLAEMDPKALDFNPHFFNNPTLIYYVYGAGIYAGHLLGLIRADGTDRFYFENPEHVARMILVGRWLSVLLGTATVWLIYLLTRRLGFPRGVGWLAALFLALYPSHIVHCKFMTVNIPVAFFAVAAFLALERWLRRGGTRSLLFVGLAAGLAVSSKFTALLLLPIIVLAGLFRVRALAGPEGRTWGGAAKETLTVLAVTGAVFLMGTPYVLLALPEFMDTFRGFLFPSVGKGQPAGMATRSAAIYVFASTPLILALAALGMAHLARRRSPIRILFLLFTLAFIAVTLKASRHIASDSRFMLGFVFLALLAAVGLFVIWSWRRRAAVGVLVLTLLSLAVWDHAFLARFVGTQPQELSSAWLKENVRGKATVHVAGDSYFYHPDVIVREYLHVSNVGNYERETEWTFVAYMDATTGLFNRRLYDTARPQEPEFVVLTEHLSSGRARSRWLDDPGYEVAAHFPGKFHLFGRRVDPMLDIYDRDIWILRRGGGGEASP